MKKTVNLLLILVAVVLTACTLVACNGKNEEVEVLPAQTVHVASVADFTNMRNYLGKAYSNYTFVLDDDIDLSGVEEWVPIGDSVENAFCATFDGNGKSVNNLSFRGWNSDGSPKIENLGAESLENTTSFPTMAIFGYSANATFKNVSVNNVDFEFYADNGFSYTAGLVAYNVGASVFENISVSGNIKFNNVYVKKNTYNNAGERQGAVYSCDATIYAGGINAYTNGNSVFNNVSCDVNFNNDFTRAYLYNKDNAEPEEIEADAVVEGYRVEGYVDDASAAPSQVFVGGVCAVAKSGEIKNSYYSGNVDVYAKSVYAGGIVGAGYGTTVTECTVEGASAVSGAHVKSAVGGIIALADDCDVSYDTVKDFTVKSGNYLNAQSMSVGGIFAFACNAADISDSEVETLKATVDFKYATVGGIGGVLRDAKLSSSECRGADFKITARAVTKENCESIFATVVNAVYNNALLDSDNSADSVKVFLGAENWNATNRYSTKNSTSYVDENGKPGIRLFEKDRTDKFVYVFAEKQGEDLRVSVYNEELTLLSEAVYARNEGFEASENMAQSYLDVYFEAGVGFKAATSGALTAEGRDIAGYEYRSGTPSIPA